MQITTLCGRPVVPEDLVEAGRYQEIDIPPVTVEVTEHRYYRSQCDCGALTGHAAPGLESSMALASCR